MTSSQLGGGASTKNGVRTYIVVGGADGSVKFYDLKFRIEAWFEDLAAGPVTSVSFGAAVPHTSKGGTLEVPDFVIGTRQGYILTAGGSLFEELDPSKRSGTVLLQGVKDAITAISAHPLQPQLAAACVSGDVVAWDYDLKIVAAVRTFDAAKLKQPLTLAHHPNGQMLAVGFTSGSLRLIDSALLLLLPVHLYSAEYWSISCSGALKLMNCSSVEANTVNS
eukprot:14445-Heterococcus_DN1.PRE.3